MKKGLRPQYLRYVALKRLFQTADLMKKGLRRRIRRTSNHPSRFQTADLMKKGLRLVSGRLGSVIECFRPQT